MSLNVSLLVSNCFFISLTKKVDIEIFILMNGIKFSTFDIKITFTNCTIRESEYSQGLCESYICLNLEKIIYYYNNNNNMKLSSIYKLYLFRFNCILKKIAK